MAVLSSSIVIGCAARGPTHGLRAAGLPHEPAPEAAPDARQPEIRRLPLSDAYRIPGSPTGCEGGMARAGAFCIDRFEAHLVDDEGKPHPFNRPVDGARLRARSAPGTSPQGHINQLDAGEACGRAGKRLCTKSEWRKACGGMGLTLYPYGDAKVSGACNSERVHPPSRLFGLDYRTRLNDPELNLFPGGLALTGSHPRCVSDYGVFDMVGNLHEWVSDRITVRGQVRGVFMGGFYSNDHENGHGCEYMTVAHIPQHFDYSTGFRCCSDPK